MKRTLVTLCIGVVFVFISARALTVTGQAATGSKNAASASNDSATEVKVGLRIENRDLAGASVTFDIAPDTKIYGWARVQGVPTGSSVAIGFKKGDKEVFRHEVPVSWAPFRVNAYRTFRAGDGGEWTLTVSGPDGKELASTTFKVTIKK